MSTQAMMGVTAEHYVRGLSADEVRERVDARWDCSGEFPVPKWAVRCPCCGATECIIRRVNFHAKHEATVPWRSDVGMKCTACSLTFNFGVAITEELYRRMEARGEKRMDRARLAEILEET